MIEQITQEFRGRHHTERIDWMLGSQAVADSEHSGDGLAVDPVQLSAHEELSVLWPQAPGLVGPVSKLNGSILEDSNRVQDSEFTILHSTHGTHELRPSFQQVRGQTGVMCQVGWP